MGLATIDPHSQSANQAFQNPQVWCKSTQYLSKIQPFENVKIYKEMYGHPDAVRQSRSALSDYVDNTVSSLN